MGKKEETKVREDIKQLIIIQEELEKHCYDDEWEFSEFHREELYRITNDEDDDWDDSHLMYYIGGMQKALQLLEEA